MNPVREALWGALSDDPGLNALLSQPWAIYHQVAPQDAVTPFVVFHKQAGTPDYRFDGHVQEDLWTVKAVDLAEDAGAAEDIDREITRLLTDAPLSVAGHHLIACFRESDVDYPEADGADTYRHVGGVFRVETTPL